MSNAARVLRSEPESQSQTGEALKVSRIFDSPVSEVWNACSIPETVQRWWGPEGFTSPGVQLDFRVGGKYLSGMRGPDGKEYWSTGVYREIFNHRRIVSTDQFSDPQGNVISPAQVGMPGKWPSELTIELNFSEVEPGKTKLEIRHEGIPPEMREECIQGWNGSLDKLQRLVERS